MRMFKDGRRFAETYDNDTVEYLSETSRNYSVLSFYV